MTPNAHARIRSTATEPAALPRHGRCHQRGKLWFDGNCLRGSLPLDQAQSREELLASGDDSLRVWLPLPPDGVRHSEVKFRRQ